VNIADLTTNFLIIKYWYYEIYRTKTHKRVRNIFYLYGFDHSFCPFSLGLCL